MDPNLIPVDNCLNTNQVQLMNGGGGHLDEKKHDEEAESKIAITDEDDETINEQINLGGQEEEEAEVVEGPGGKTTESPINSDTFWDITIPTHICVAGLIFETFFIIYSHSQTIYSE